MCMDVFSYMTKYELFNKHNNICKVLFVYVTRFDHFLQLMHKRLHVIHLILRRWAVLSSGW